MNLVSFAASSAFFFFFKIVMLQKYKNSFNPIGWNITNFPNNTKFTVWCNGKKQTREPQSQLNVALSTKMTWVRISSRAGEILGSAPEPPTLTSGITSFKPFAFVMFSSTQGYFCDGYLHFGVFT